MLSGLLPNSRLATPVQIHDSRPCSFQFMQFELSCEDGQQNGLFVPTAACSLPRSSLNLLRLLRFAPSLTSHTTILVLSSASGVYVVSLASLDNLILAITPRLFAVSLACDSFEKTRPCVLTLVAFLQNMHALWVRSWAIGQIFRRLVGCPATYQTIEHFNMPNQHRMIHRHFRPISYHIKKVTLAYQFRC